MSPLAGFLAAPHTVLYLANVALAVVLTSATALLANLAWRRSPAPARHGLLWLALLGALASPALVWLADRVGVGRLQVTLGEERDALAEPRVVPLTGGPAADARRSPQVLDRTGTRRRPDLGPERPASELDAGVELPVSLRPEPDRSGDEVASPSRPARGETGPWWSSLGQKLALIWAAGTILSLLRLLCGFVRLAAFRRGLHAVGWDSVPTELAQDFEPLPTGSGRSPNLRSVRQAAVWAAAQVGLGRMPRLFTSAQTPTPVTFGLFRPAVVLPESLADDLPADQLDAVLVHEMAHVVRRDPWVGLMQRLAAAFYWWCPLVQRLNRRLADVREEVCDNYVLGSQDDGASLAEVLVTLAERLASPAPLPATVSMLEYRQARERSRALEQRIRRLLSPETSPMTRMNRVSLLLVVLAGVGMTVAISLSHVRAAGEDIPATESGAADSPGRDAVTPTPAEPNETHAVVDGEREQSRVIAEIKQRVGEVTHDENRPGRPVVEVVLYGSQYTDGFLERLCVFPELRTLVLMETNISEAGLAHLQKLSSLRTLVLSLFPVSGSYLDRLQDLPQLQELVLTRAQVGDAGLAHLQRLPQLQALSLIDNPVTDAGLIVLQSLPQLRRLTLQRTRATNAGLKHLRGLTQLQQLNLHLLPAPITDAGLADIGNLTSLRELELPSAAVSDAGLERLSSLTQLAKLNLQGARVSGAGLTCLARLRQLADLRLDYTKVNDESLVHLEGMTQLRTLNLAGTGVSDAGLVHLSGLTQLVNLNLEYTKVTDAGLVHVQGLTRLETLNLSRTKVTEAGMRHFAALTSLANLDLYGIPLSDAGLVHFRGLRRLERLNLRKAQVTDAGLRNLCGCESLQELNLNDTPITDAALEHLRGLTELVRLDLNNTRITGSGLAHLANLKQLQGLNLRGTQVTDQGLAHLRDLTQLRGLSLGKTNVTDAGLAQLRGLSQLRGLDLTGTRVTDAGLEHLSGLTRLWELGLDDTEVTGKGLVHLRAATGLSSLSLDAARADPAAVRPFTQALPHVQIDPWFLTCGWDEPTRSVELKLTPATGKIFRALGQPTRFEFIRTPLADAVTFLADHHDIPIRLDEPQLRAAGIAGDAPVTKSYRGITLHSVLRLVLGQLALTYVLRDDALVITTEEEGRRLAQQGVVGRDEVQRELTKSTAFTAANRRIRSALQADSRMDAQAPLNNVVDFLEDQHEILIEIDERGLASVGVKPDVICTLNLKQVPLASVLDKLLGELGLTYVVDDEVLLITAPKKGVPVEAAKDEG